MGDDLRFARFQRLEPRVRPDGHGGFLDAALEARVGDPLFLLARQWQLAELAGEDGGSPVAARLEAQSAPLTRFRAGDGGPPVELPGDRPLEDVVEHGTDPGLSLRARARAGLHFLTILGDLADRLAGPILQRCPLPPVPAIDGVRDADPAGRALHGVLAPRAPDGQVLAEQLAGGWRPPGLSPADAARFADAARRWRRWFAAAHPAPGRSSWVRERLEHRFSVGAAFGDEQVVLHAPEYGGGRLDAYQLEIDPSPARALHAPPTPPETVVRTTLPARATYPGMPAERWWQFEDATVNLPAVSAGPPDLAQLLLIEFANVYGNDWWVIPVDLRVGAVHRMSRLTVTDTFGDTLAIRPTDLVHADGWSVFRLTDAVTGRPGPPLLPLLPTASTLTEGEPVEEVLFARDEMANLAWAVERVVESATGRPRRRADEVPADGPAAAHPPGAPGAPAWRLLSPPPPHWVPLLPVPLAEGSAAIQFRRGRIPRPGSPAAGHLVQAVGRVLEPGARRVTFREEEITRAGVRVTRVPVVARWLGGTTAAWTGRRAETGRGEASSGLAFDDAPPAAGR